MPDLSIEAIAILTYTGIALFLSLYFVPFKIVPRAWAKAVQTEGHPAKKALDAVLDRAVAKIVFPAIPPFPTIPEFPNTKELTESVASLGESFNSLIPTINFLKGQVTDEHLLELIKKSRADAEMMEGVREGRGQLDGDIVRQAGANPDGVNMLQWAIRGLDGLAKNKLITKATAKDYTRQLKEEFARTGDITNLANEFGVSLSGYSGGTPSVSVRPKGGGFNPG